jgi:hypothetical protein
MPDNRYRVKKRFLWWYVYIRKHGKPLEFNRFSKVVWYVIQLKKKDKERELNEVLKKIIT